MGGKIYLEDSASELQYENYQRLQQLIGIKYLILNVLVYIWKAQRFNHI